MPERHLDERELDRFLDDLVVGRQEASGYAIGSDVIETIQAVRSLGTSPLPKRATEHVESTLHAEIARMGAERKVEQTRTRLAPLSVGPSTFTTNGRARTSNSFLASAAWEQRRSWGLQHVATAALLLVTLIASMFAFVPGHLGTSEGPTSLLAASETPATPDPVAAPIAEFLWQSPGGTDFTFVELGRPAIDPEGDLWVPEASESQFVIFAPDGKFRETWGMPGSGEGEFDFACPGVALGGVAFDEIGRAHV